MPSLIHFERLPANELIESVALRNECAPFHCTIHCHVRRNGWMNEPSSQVQRGRHCHSGIVYDDDDFHGESKTLKRPSVMQYRKWRFHTTIAIVCGIRFLKQQRFHFYLGWVDGVGAMDDFCFQWQAGKEADIDFAG